MSDLHKPLGESRTPTKGRSWQKPFAGTLVLGAAALAAYLFYDARQSPRTVIALGLEEVIEKEEPKPVVAPQADTSGTQPEIALAPGQIKPLSPLEPLEGEELPPESRSEPIRPQKKRAFRPKKAPKTGNNPWAPVADLVEKSEFGPLPRISNTGLRPLDAYSESSGSIGANRIAIVVGGMGLSQSGTQDAIRKLPSGVTLGFSPLGNSLQRWMQAARRDGHEVALQLPMEPLGYPAVNPGPRTLTSAATLGENLANLRWALGRMTNYPVVMNYLGGGMKSKDAALRPILDEIKNRGLAYFDDGTAESSVALEIAAGLRLPNLQGNTVLDARRDEASIRNRLAAIEALAKQRGYAVATATGFPQTVDVITKWAEAAEKRGVLIVPLSNLVKDYKR